MQAGFIVTAGALLPPLFALYGRSEGAVLRIASAITAIPIAWFVASVPRRRRVATGAATPGFIRLFLLLQLCAAVTLALGALGRPLGPGVAPYASALTLILVTSGLAFRSEEHTSELQSHLNLVCRLLLEKKKNNSFLQFIPHLFPI